MLSACTGNNGLDNLTCAVSTPDVSMCQSIPTLNKGTLNLKQNGSFELSGDYVSCFQSSHVLITGRYQHVITPQQIIEMELSAETIAQEDDLDRSSGFFFESLDRVVHGLIRLPADVSHADGHAGQIFIQTGILRLTHLG